MMIIGTTPATMNPKELPENWQLYPYTLFRQIVLPLICFGVLKLLIRDEFILGITAILLMMPVANTTLFSIVTIPLLIFICF